MPLFPDTRASVQCIQTLPPLPPLAKRLLKLPGSLQGYPFLEQLLQHPRVCDRLIKITGQTILANAVNAIGEGTCRQLVLGILIQQTLPTEHVPAFDLTRYWTHALATAEVLEMLCKHNGMNCRSDAFAYQVGLLNNLGLYALVAAFPTHLQSALSDAHPMATVNQICTHELGLNRHAAAAVLLTQWEMPIWICKLQMSLAHGHPPPNDLQPMVALHATARQWRRFRFDIAHLPLAYQHLNLVNQHQLAGAAQQAYARAHQVAQQIAGVDETATQAPAAKNDTPARD